MREEEQGQFAVTSLEQLTKEFNLDFRPKTLMMHGGQEGIMKELEEQIGKEGGLTEEDLKKWGITRLEEDKERPKSELIG
ncbi:MAG: hypothetical protein ABIH38_02510 [Patescibacteria group bacterium]